ncbi:MAG: FAD-dependent oxidoreductase, partial [Gemmatimonadota bacterium]|nr:FAD-dependent oxidoreductase [Gemmatimonadota bacterium]
THDAALRWLLTELSLENRLRFRHTSMGIYREGRLHPFDGPRDLLRFDAISFPARLRFGLASLVLAYTPGLEDDDGDSALGWLRRRAGEEATEAIWEPLFRSKFGDHAERIPVAWLAGRVRQRYRSRDGVDEKLGYLGGSLQLLVDRLVERIEAAGGELRLATPATGLIFEDGGVAGVETGGGPVRGDLILSTVPTPVLGSLIEDRAPEYARRLGAIEYMGAICVVLSLTESLSPVYWLNVADPGFSFGGVIEQTRLVPPSEYGGRHVVYLSRYVEADNKLWQMGDDALWERQRSELARMFGDRVYEIVHERHVFRGRYAAPVTDLGFGSRVPTYDAPLESLYVAAMPQVYPDERSTNNSIRVAAAALAAAGFDVSEVPEGASLAARHGWRNPP